MAIVIWKLDSHKKFYADPAMSLAIALIIFGSAVPLSKQLTFLLTIIRHD